MSTDLDALEALTNAATPGPWTADATTRGDCVVWGPDGAFVANTQAEPHWLPAPDGGKRLVTFDVDRRDVALIAAARNALPELIAEVRQLRERAAHPLHIAEVGEDGETVRLTNVDQLLAVAEAAKAWYRWHPYNDSMFAFEADLMTAVRALEALADTEPKEALSE